MTTEQNNEFIENIIKIIEKQEKISDRFVNVCRIDPYAGDGVFSYVFKAQDLLSKKRREVALKFFDFQKTTDKYRVECFHREIGILEELRDQRNILPLVQGKTDLTIVLDYQGLSIPLPLMFYCSYLAKFSVKQYIYQEKTDFLKNILYFREMCKAIQRIHSKHICHRDLKPANFLVYPSPRKQKPYAHYVCLSDFGTARHFGEKEKPILDQYQSPVGDTRYTAPELLCGLYFSDRHNYCADIYSLGTILFELFTKTILGEVIFADRIDMIRDFSVVPELKRIEYFDGIIDGIAKGRELPSVRTYDENIPKSLSYEIDGLYKSMACINYKCRENDFQNIFKRIETCKTIILNQEKFERWRKFKEERRKGQL